MAAASSKDGSPEVFTIHANTNILANSKITFASAITHFTTGHENNLTLANPADAIVFAYVPPSSEVSGAVKLPEVKNKNSIAKTSGGETLSLFSGGFPKIKNTQNLPAAAVRNGVLSENYSSFYIWPEILFFFLNAGGESFILFGDEELF